MNPTNATNFILPRCDKPQPLSLFERRFMARLLDNASRVVRIVRRHPHVNSYCQELCARYRDSLLERLANSQSNSG